MLTAEQTQVLLEAHHTFIQTEEFNLNSLQDLIEKTIPDVSSLDRAAWTQHASALSEAYRRIHKDNENVPWPSVCAYSRVDT